MTEPVTAPQTRPLDGIAAFYATLWDEARSAATRWHLAVVVEIAMILAWFAIRTVADVDGRAYALWVVAAGALALVAPMSGLVVFIGTSAFFEPDSLARSMSPRELIVLPLAAGVLIRIVADRFRWRPEPAVWVALAPARRDRPGCGQHVLAVQRGHRAACGAVVDREHGGSGRSCSWPRHGPPVWATRVRWSPPASPPSWWPWSA